MDDDSKLQGLVKWGLGIIGLGAVAAAVTIPKIGIWIALAILVLALLLFGGYFLWQQRRARRQREQFTSAIEAQTSARPTVISDPNRRAALDKVRQKFQAGLQEYKSRGKDIYQLPWYVIIGESGSGKTEAIRHSGIDFPPGLQDELQGSGGTINMDWWFTNRGIILDTAGSMIFSEAGAGEAPEWREFLRLLRKARPHCPVNGLFLVLSVESLIRDSAERIAQKAGVLAQQLDLIQRTLDVRFPVYLLVTKCDLLIGFREFFDSIEDPLLQHQVFGWSNPDPLDAPFRPDLIEKHLGSVAERLRRRRLALLRESSGPGRIGDTQQFFASSYQLGRGAAGARRLDEVDSMFALPESIMRLAPRLRRYLETIFVAGEWSAKPVFLRGVYFTSSMREGKALDEAIAFATGLSLDQLPEERAWEKNRAFFLRDLFHEKVFRESGLVTRATNTLQLLRQRQVAIFGTAGGALLALLVFAGFAYSNLKKSVLTEAAYWQAGTNWNPGQGTWSPIVSPSGDSFRFIYGGTNVIPIADNPTLVRYHQQLHQIAEKRLAVSFIFKPMEWINAGSVKDRAKAQRRLFEGSVLRPLVRQTQAKLNSADPKGGTESLARHQEALLSLMKLEADARIAGNQAIANTNIAADYLRTFLAYLTESGIAPAPELVKVFALTYSKTALDRNDGTWPPKDLLGGDTLAANTAIASGIGKFHKASMQAQTNIEEHLKLVDDLADKFLAYHQRESNWLTNTTDSCGLLTRSLVPAKSDLDAKWKALESSTNFPAEPLTNLSARYELLAAAASGASASAFKRPVDYILLRLPVAEQRGGLFIEIKAKLEELAGQAADSVLASFNSRAAAVTMVDTNCLAAAATNSVELSYQARWSLYTNACALASSPLEPGPSDVGQRWQRFGQLKELADNFTNNLTAYKGPLADRVSVRCRSIAVDAEKELKGGFVDSYVKMVTDKLREIENQSRWTMDNITNARSWFERIQTDVSADKELGPGRAKLAHLTNGLKESKAKVLRAIENDLRRQIGFPVLLESTKTMDLPGLRSARELLAGLPAQFQNPVWQADASGALRSLQMNADRYESIVGGLARDDGNPAEWEIFFVPPVEATDRAIISVFRYVQVSVVDKTSLKWDEISGATGPMSLGKWSVDSGVQISFRKLDTDPSSEFTKVKHLDWAFARLIRDFKADRRENGTAWRFQIKVEDTRQRLTGNITFEARLIDATRRLPKLEDWPKQ